MAMSEATNVLDQAQSHLAQVQSAVDAAQGFLDSAQKFTESVERSKGTLKTVAIVLVAGVVVVGVAGLVFSRRRK
jgi:t-SNARE complex subunit (syntaxin)